MDIRKIIKESIDDFEWIKSTEYSHVEKILLPYTNLGVIETINSIGVNIYLYTTNNEWVFYYSKLHEEVVFNPTIFKDLLNNDNNNQENFFKDIKKWLLNYYNIKDVKVYTTYSSTY